jgi:hypothetical protein
MWVEAVDDFYDFFIFLLRTLSLPVSWKCIYILFRNLRAADCGVILRS